MNEEFIRRMKSMGVKEEELIPDNERKEKELVSDFMERAKDNELLNRNGIRFVNGTKYTFYKVATIILIIILALGIAGFLYLIDKGSLKSAFSFACGNVSLACSALTCPMPNIPACPSCPSCGDCSVKLNCGNQS